MKYSHEIILKQFKHRE